MNIGAILVIASLVLSTGAIVFYLKNYYDKSTNFQIPRNLYYITSILITFSFLLLLSAFLNYRFEYAYVYDNSSRELSTLYLISAVWAGKEGSFLLWALILNVVGIFLIRFKDDNEAILMAVLLISQIFFLAILVMDSPFQYLWDKFPDEIKMGQIPQNGAGLNPLLADPWMVTHPPILFMGYASATIPFAYAIAGLLKKEYKSWINSSYKWLLFSVITLGIGIFLGGYWSYKVLGWGGYWGWDPVENSSLIPWLISIALLHGMIIQRRKNALVKTNIFFAIFYFVLVLFSTFLTRSGVLANFSVHSFASYSMSVYLGAFIIVTGLAALALFIYRFSTVESSPLDSSPTSWDNFTVYGIIIVTIFALITLGGTVFPLVSGLFVKNPTAITTNFYNNIVFPIGMILVTLMTIATVVIRMKPVKFGMLFIFSVASIGAAVLFNIFYTKDIRAYITVAFGFTIISIYIYDLIKFKTSAVITSTLTHMGIGILLLGFVASNFHSTNFRGKLIKDKESTIGNVNITLKGMGKKDGNDAVMFSLRNGKSVENFSSDYYFSDRTNSLYREPHIERGFLGDIYIIPENYQTGVNELFIVLKMNEEIKYKGFKINFLKFVTKNMQSAEMTIYADIFINGKKVKPGIKFSNNIRFPIEVKIPGTDKKISLQQIDPGKKLIQIYISPGKGEQVPQDSVTIDISHKRLIWLVWLGTILISLGAAIALFKLRKKETDK